MKGVIQGLNHHDRWVTFAYIIYKATQKSFFIKREVFNLKPSLLYVVKVSLDKTPENQTL